MAKPPSRILMRITVDSTHADLLQDLLQHAGRHRARRIVFLAALGKLAEHGALQAGLPPNPSKQSDVARQDERASRNAGDGMRPITSNPEDVAFLARLQDDLP